MYIYVYVYILTYTHVCACVRMRACMPVCVFVFACVMPIHSQQLLTVWLGKMKQDIHSMKEDIVEEKQVMLKHKTALLENVQDIVTALHRLPTDPSVLPDELVQQLCTLITDENILSILQPIIKGLVRHQLTFVRFRDWHIDWKAERSSVAAVLEGAAVLAAAMAYSRSLTDASLWGECMDHMLSSAIEYTCTYIFMHICIYV